MQFEAQSRQRQEIKGNLARLLATENLVVEHRTDIPTASFDVDRRVLQLPQWDKASGVVYDMLVGHEVGHALYTPNEDYTDYVQCPKDYVNVVEDVRIEKLMKRKYPGLRKSFAGGYKELNDQDFFQIEGEDVSQILLVDRINLHYKVGPTALIPFSDDEFEFVKRVELTETFEEVCALADEIYQYTKAENEEKQKQAAADPQGGLEMDGQPEDGEEEDDGLEEGYQTPTQPNSSPQQEDTADLETPSFSEGGEEGGKQTEGDVSKTQRSFDDAATQLSSSGGYNIKYFEIPENIDTKDFVVDWSEVHEWIDSRFAQTPEPKISMGEDGTVYWKQLGLSDADSEYSDHRREAQKEVNYLVKEFECRKSADAYARATTAKTGVLDCTKLHTYKYNEDLFKKVTVIPDGKNHGLIFLLDWSGSMAEQLHSTYKQVLNLTAFCKKVQIPFEVYAFTNEWRVVELIKKNDPDAAYRYYHEAKDVTVGKFHLPKDEFHMLNILSSRCNSREYENQCKNIWRITWAYDQHRGGVYQIPEGMNLSGTPLNEAIVMLNYIIPQFRKQNDLQKVNAVILTDGEACCSGYGRKSDNERTGEVRTYASKIGYGNALRDRKTGTVYRPLTNSYTGLTNQLLKQVQDRNPGVNVLGFRIMSGNRLQEFVCRYSKLGSNYSEIQSQWRKNKSVIVPNPLGYTALYAIQQTALDNSTDFDVESGSKKADISRAFKKMLKSKSTNKKLLNSFIGYVA